MQYKEIYPKLKPVSPNKIKVLTALKPLKPL